MKIYISGKITGLSLEDAFDFFELAEAHLLNKGHDPINPIKANGIDGTEKAVTASWRDYMMADIALLFDCDAIYMLKNWQDSKGAKIERAIAEHLGLQIHYQGTL